MLRCILEYSTDVYFFQQASPYAAMLAAQDVAVLCKERGITALHIKMRASGGTKWVLGRNIYMCSANNSGVLLTLGTHEQ